MKRGVNHTRSGVGKSGWLFSFFSLSSASPLPTLLVMNALRRSILRPCFHTCFCHASKCDFKHTYTSSCSLDVLFSLHLRSIITHHPSCTSLTDCPSPLPGAQHKTHTSIALCSHAYFISMAHHDSILQHTVPHNVNLSHCILRLWPPERHRLRAKQSYYYYCITQPKRVRSAQDNHAHHRRAAYTSDRPTFAQSAQHGQMCGTDH